MAGTCRRCAGTGRWLWTAATKSGGTKIIRYGPCPDCNGAGKR